MNETWWTKPEELDDDQKEVINLSSDDDHLVTGPPGSGKTNLLVLRATYLHLQGRHDLAVVTFNRTLREFLCSATENYEFTGDKIQTYIKWGIETLIASGAKFEGADNFIEQRQRVTDGLASLIESSSQLHRLDCILLDEAQDYSADEIDIFRAFGKRIFAVADARQQIYDARGGLARLQQYCGDPITLKYHYRNGLKICRVADAIYDQLEHPDGLESTSQYDEHSYPSSVESVPCASIEEQGGAIVSNVVTQLRAYPEERIGVACPRHQELDEIWNVIQKSGIGAVSQIQRQKEGYNPLSPNKRVCVTTLHGTKGMEFRAPHIAGTEFIKKFRQRQKKLIYTGVTRAKTSLSIYHTDSLPGYLENAISATEKASASPSLEDLFRK